MGVSNHLVGLLNFLSLLISIPIIGAGIWLATKHSTDCVRFLQWPVIGIGLFILLVSLAGLIGSCCRVTWLLWVYLAVMLLLIIALFAVTVLALVVTSKGSGETVSGRGYEEYHLDKYSKWLQDQVSKAGNWEKIKSCIQDAKVCKNFNYTDSNSFYKAKLSPLQSGCCKPPTVCNYTYVNATEWNTTFDARYNYSDEADCTVWDNDQSKLCYDCDSCRAGVIENLRHDWRKVAIINVIVLIFLVVVYSLGCCAFRNSRRDGFYHKMQPRYVKGYP